MHKILIETKQRYAKIAKKCRLHQLFFIKNKEYIHIYIKKPLIPDPKHTNITNLKAEKGLCFFNR